MVREETQINWRSRVFQVLRFSLLLYLGILLVLLFLENKLVYPAISAQVEWWEPTNLHKEDITWQLPQAEVHAWWCPIESAERVLLFCHGNGGNLSHRAEGIRKWQQSLNASVLIFDYPGYGKSTGSPSEAGCYESAMRAYQYLVDEKKYPANKILVYGASLGGAVATKVASERPCQGVVLVNTFTALPDVGQRQYPFLPVNWLMRNRFDSASRIDAINVPMVISHAKADRVVPFDHGEKLFALANEPKLFLSQENADHNTPLPEEFFVDVRNFLQQNTVQPVSEEAN